MLDKILDAFSRGKSDYTSYRIGLVQAKAYRLVKNLTGEALKKYELSSIDWAMIGLLYDFGEMRYGELAEALGVEAPFVSVLAEGLEQKGYVKETKSTTDKRVKNIHLTKKGERLVPELEAAVRAKIDPLFEHIGQSDISRYVHTLERIVVNGDDAKNT
jgi:DNA-binding MarR family transcriptional regulator